MDYQINLLPWREQERSKYQRRFISLLCFGVILSVAVQWGAAQYLEQQNAIQVQRNRSLDSHIGWLNDELKELNDIGKQHDSILTRLGVVEELQQNRNTTTQLLNVLPEMITEGIYLNKVRMHKKQVEIKGFSDSNARLASMLDKLEHSPSIASVEMHSIVSGKKIFGHDVSSFDVSFRLLSLVKEKSND
ncbi:MULTISPECIES: PilN domain-containing protein [unclassified Aliivibrio]|jgi:type IV pilus assembly protein PilN|uniref:PilN domain-containing protein n=1 Tax=unclassified Aliivibrio TaxID=2645654 RepID=UPI00080DCDDA|nr:MULTISPECIES: PilN domain-containing protein [unclassified Aliivibrio]OCH13296.1 pilus assembly protein PilN [Aliivibrio sp. 1S165]OCH25297.1 pilus assembly protein PilN [Aliivibrio sp. 1S128]OCH28014.1 pilus assembly protein PilN [Aliivibrio sp. 1S175]